MEQYKYCILYFIIQPQNGGVVMVNFLSSFLNSTGEADVWDAVGKSLLMSTSRSRLRNDFITFSRTAHINHMRSVAGVDYIGIGADYCGTEE